MATIRDKLSGYTPEQPYNKRRIVSVKEKGKRYNLTFPDEKLCAVFQVDGDIIKEGLKCDKLILVNGNEENFWSEFFVELKGQDINHAIDQLSATLKKDIFKHETVKTKYARIVGKSIPRSTGNSILDRAKIRFIKDHNCDLRAVGSGTTEKYL